MFPSALRSAREPRGRAGPHADTAHRGRRPEEAPCGLRGRRRGRGGVAGATRPGCDAPAVARASGASRRPRPGCLLRHRGRDGDRRRRGGRGLDGGAADAAVRARAARPLPARARADPADADRVRADAVPHARRGGPRAGRRRLADRRAAGSPAPARASRAAAGHDRRRLVRRRPGDRDRRARRRCRPRRDVGGAGARARGSDRLRPGREHAAGRVRRRDPARRSCCPCSRWST